MMIEEIKDRIICGGEITDSEAVWLINTADASDLYKAANEIREHFTGRTFDMCSIINAKSGKCSEDCKWCAQSNHHKTNIDEYELIDAPIAIEKAKHCEEQGVDRFSLVTSGKTITDSELGKILDIYNKIKKASDIHLCASMGLLTKEQLIKLKDAGITHYHCNLETAPSFFSTMCTTHSIEDKIHTIKYAREIGLDICSGGIIGMGESAEQRVELAFALKELEVRSIPLNVLNPIEGTPLSKNAILSEEDILRAIAVFRFINPKANIRFAGGRNLLSVETQQKALNAGINSALVGDYLTTIGTNVEEDKIMFTNSGFDLDNSNNG